MKKSEIKTDGTLTVVVYNDNILGVLYPNEDGRIWLDYIRTSIMLGGPDKRDGREVITDECLTRCRPATEVDFAKFRVMENDNTCTLKTTYNSNLVEECRKLGGRWDVVKNVWVFSDLVKDEVDALDAKYNSEPVKVEVTVLKNLFANRGAVKIGGYGIAKAYGPDSGAKIRPRVTFIKGEPKSGGSYKNWHTEVPKGSVFRIRVPVNCLDDLAQEGIEIKVLD